MSGWGYFFLVLLLLIILIPTCWIVYTRIRASRAGLPPPPWSSYLRPFSTSRKNEASASRIYPASRSPLDWVKEKFSSLRGGGRSTGGGAYEPTHAGAGRRGLDPDEAWDSSVGAEADAYGAGGYYEEQELGLHPPPVGSTAYTGASGRSGGGGGGGVMPDYGEERHAPGRGRSLSRDDAFVGGSQGGLDERYDEEVHLHGGGDARGRGGEDPFGDHAERSELRGVSPRPVAAEDEREGGGLKVGNGKKGDLSPTERRSMFRESI